MFSLTFLQHKPMYKALSAENCSSGDTAASAAANQNPPSKSLVYSFSQSFISSGKQGCGTTVLKGGWHCNERNLPLCKQLTKSSCAASCTFLRLGHAKLRLGLLGTAVLMSNSHRLLIIHSPQGSHGSEELLWPFKSTRERQTFNTDIGERSLTLLNP
jgi:hypothetical protein